MRKELIFPFTLILILFSIYACGCSGTQVKPDSPFANNTTDASNTPVPAGETNVSAFNVTVPNSSIQLISVDKAVDIVHLFTGNPSVNVSCECLGYNYLHPAYSLVSDSDSFLVNAYTGEVEYANFSRPPGTMVLNVENARQIAEDFARKHYSSFNAMPGLRFLGCQLHNDDGGYYYECEWRQTVNDTDTLNFVVVSVDAFDGDIYRYQSMCVSPESPASPPVTMRDAVRAAVAYVVNLTGDTGITASDTSSERFTDWWFNATARDNNKTSPGYVNLTIKPTHADLALIDGDGRLREIVWNIDQLQGYQLYSYNGSDLMVPGLHWGKVYVDVSSGRVVKFIPCR